LLFFDQIKMRAVEIGQAITTLAISPAVRLVAVSKTKPASDILAGYFFLPY
jgi:uncharacterized pyridoxal phosphate-containing UPF0001 family protein